MRLNEVLATALYSSAAILGNVRAEDADDAADSSSTSVAESSTSSVVEKPNFTVRQTGSPPGQSLLDSH